MMQSKFSIAAIIFTMLLAIVVGCAETSPTPTLKPPPVPAPELESAPSPTPAVPAPTPPQAQIPMTTPRPLRDSDLVMKSTKTESILSVELEASQETLFFLDSPQNVFLTVMFWVEPAADIRTIDMKNIVVASGVSDRFYPVGLRGGEGSWIFVFTSGTCQIELVSENQNQAIRLIYDLEYDSNNNYGIKNEHYRTYSNSGTAEITMQREPSLTLAYVVAREYISNGHLRLELPDSQPIVLEVR